MTNTIELRGITLHGRHGVEAEERERGQRFVFDVWIDVDDSALSDRIEDAVDYRDVVATVHEVSAARAYRLLEALAVAIADALGERLQVAYVQVRVRKPEVKLESPVEFAAVTAEWTPRGS